MPRTPATYTQADIARIIRAHRNEGVKVRTRLNPDLSIDFEEVGPIAAPQPDDESPPKEIVL